MNKKTQALLVDVVQLVSKHGIDTFDLLAREIRKDEFVNNLAQILERIATESARSCRRTEPWQVCESSASKAT